LKLLFISTENPFPVDHGHHIRTFHTLQALAKDYQVFFLCFSQNDIGFAHKSELEKYCQAVEIVDIRSSRFRLLSALLKNLISNLPYTAEKYYHPEALTWIKDLIYKHKIDIVHVDMLHLANYKSQFNGVPAVLVNHNVESLRMMRWAQVEKNPFLKMFLLYQQSKIRLFEQRMCALFDLVITVSDADKVVLEELCSAGRFETIPNGVDTRYFAPRPPLEKAGRHIVWTGGMGGPYNRDAVVFFINEIWPLLFDAVPDVRATFVGGSPPEQLVSLARSQPNIKVAGYVDDVRPFVDEADVFVVPLRAGSGTKIKVLNAMAQGKAIVSTSIGIEGIAAETGRDVLIADTAGEFARKTAWLLSNRERAQEMGKRARELMVRFYDAEAIGSELRELYRGITNA
jgi:glycosyltransferase involved in cell wall biosynthesis